RDPLVTGVQTCALPISAAVGVPGEHDRLALVDGPLLASDPLARLDRVREHPDVAPHLDARVRIAATQDLEPELGHPLAPLGSVRSEERRGGRACTCERV